MTSPDLLRPPFIRHIRVSAFNVSFVRSMLFMSVQCYFYVRTVIFMYFQCNLNASKSSWSCKIIFKGKILQQMLPNLMWITTQSCWLSTLRNTDKTKTGVHELYGVIQWFNYRKKLCGLFGLLKKETASNFPA